MHDAAATLQQRSGTALTFSRCFPFAILFVALALVPLIATWWGSPFLVRVFTRIVIFAITATALNLVLGFGGLMSLLHAGLFGLGAYAVGILAQHDFNGDLFLGIVPGTSELLLSLPVAVLLVITASAVFGIISLRTSGAYFIMITLAFNQMLYYFFVSLQKYGGDDGLQVLSAMTMAGFDSTAHIPFYYVCLATLIATAILISHIVNSPFGLVLRATAQNERRVVALGISPLRYKLIAFVISGAITGLAGGLWANAQQFVSPADMSWIRSGDFILMAVLGGTAYVVGPLIGAAAYLLIELVLSVWTTYWQLPLGLLIVLVVVVLENGLIGAGAYLLNGNSGDGDV
jgi:branched-chain amino acid transport system permease protein